MYGPHGFVIIWQEDSAAIIAPHIHYGWSSGVITASTVLWQQLCKAAFYHFAAASSLSRDKTCPPCREWRQCPFVLLHSGLLCVRWVRLARLPKRFEVNRLLSFLYFVSPLSSCQWPGNWSRCEILKNVSIREMYLEERGRLLKELWARSFADVFLVAMTYSIREVMHLCHASYLIDVTLKLKCLILLNALCLDSSKKWCDEARKGMYKLRNE